MVYNFDMDGTIADLYGIDDWLAKILNSNATPYEQARPLVNMARLARALNRAQRKGHTIVIISWLAKGGNADYNQAVINAKQKWLKRHLPSVQWDKVLIVEYGTPKQTLSNGVLFDDEEPNRENWGAGAFKPEEMFRVLASA